MPPESVQSDHEHHGPKSGPCASVTGRTSGIISPQPTFTFTVHLCWHNILEFVHVTWDFWWLLKGCFRCRSDLGVILVWCHLQEAQMDLTSTESWPSTDWDFRITHIISGKPEMRGRIITLKHTHTNCFILHNSFGSCQVTSYKVRWNPLWTI